MIHYYVRERTTEITSRKMARKAFIGMTLDEGLNRGNIDPVSEKEFRTKREAIAYLNTRANEYWYNGSGCGEAREFALEVENDQTCELTDFQDCQFGNFSDFKRKWDEDNEPD